MALEFPTARWGFTVGRSISWLNSEAGGVTFNWFGWGYVMVLFLLGGWLFSRGGKKRLRNPVTVRRWERFRSIRRGYISLWILGLLVLLASLDHVLVGKEALVVQYEGKMTFPALTRKVEKGKDYGLQGNLADAPADYRFLKRKLEASGEGKVFMPLVPYSPTDDTISATAEKLILQENGLLVGAMTQKPYSGLAARIYDPYQPEKIHLRYRYRAGKKDGRADGWDENRQRLYSAEYEKGKLLKEDWFGNGDQKAFLANTKEEYYIVHFPPSPPQIYDEPRHLLGTTSQGYDVVAYLYGGLQVNIKAVLIYIPCVYLIGITVGLLMGFFGGSFDLIVQRLIEIFSNIPFLYVVIIMSAAIPAQLKDSAGLGMILFILMLFGWMGMTYLMRTAALKEKARDYVAASRVIGANTGRILMRHILPNTAAILVTLVPFSLSGIVLALTSLDYLGFGLPPRYATWGKLLRDGLDHLSSPWLITASFVVLVGLLVLVTFIGEAVREALDPKKHSYYR